MRYTWLDAYLLRKRGVTKDLQPDWNWVRYHVGGRMFAAVCLNKENVPYYITLKLEPLEAGSSAGSMRTLSPATIATRSTGIPCGPMGRCLTSCCKGC